MAEEFASPEEKLLRLIRGERKSKDKVPPEKAVAPGGDKKTTAAPSNRAVAARTMQLKETRDYVKFINISLIVILVIVTAVLLVDVVSFNLKLPAYVLEVTPKTEGPHEKQTQNPTQAQQQNKAASAAADGSELLSSRELFKAVPAAGTAAAKVPQASFEKMKDLSLKGIIAGERPQAILEDEKNKKSYFLYKGDSVNNITVEDIQSDKVILKINGEVLELTL